MKFLIVDKRKRVGDLTTPHYAVTRLVEELSSRHIECDLAYFDEIDFFVKEGKFDITIQNKPLTNYTHIILRGHRTKLEYMIKKYIVDVAEQNSIKVQNSEFMKVSTFYDKLFQMKYMSENNIAHLDSAYTLDGKYYEKPELIQNIGFPMVYKHVEGENRIERIEDEDKNKKNVFLANNIEELKSLCIEHDSPEETFINKPSQYFIQKYVDIGEDYRALVIGGKYVGGYKREATQNFITVSKGNYTPHDNPDPEFIKLTEETAALFKADFCAMDIIYSDGKPYILEINMNPTFKAMETKVDGKPVDIAKLIIEQMLQ
ncbi:MAG: hypothetical protein ABIC57_01970 [bacterium]